MTDKERILTSIIGFTAHQTTPHRSQSEDSIYWDYIGSATELKKGDIVMGMTNPNHKYGIAFFEQMNGDPHDLTVREIGTNNTCNYSNEMFLVLKNFPTTSKLCGIEHKTMMKARKAINDIYSFAFAGIEFKEKELIITLRQKWVRENNLHVFTYKYDCALSKITIKALRVFLENETKSK